jgi:hypothetical protein
VDSRLLRRTEDILDIATAGEGRNQDLLILVDHRGGMRILDPAGWSFGGLDAEFGANAVYKVERREGSVRVEGRAGAERCLVQRNLTAPSLWDLPGVSSVCHPIMLQVLALPAA